MSLLFQVIQKSISPFNENVSIANEGLLIQTFYRCLSSLRIEVVIQRSTHSLLKSYTETSIFYIIVYMHMFIAYYQLPRRYRPTRLSPAIWHIFVETRFKDRIPLLSSLRSKKKRKKKDEQFSRKGFVFNFISICNKCETRYGVYCSCIASIRQELW